MRKANIYMRDRLAGVLEETDDGYQFTYIKEFMSDLSAEPISLTFPLTDKPYKGKTIFPFFDGLIPEGWLLEIAEKNWKLDPRDRMGLLMACCKDTIGAVSVEAIKSDNYDR